MKPKFSKGNSAASGIKWRCELDRSVIFENMADRGWEEASDEDEWNFYWINVGLIRKVFHPASKIRLGDRQVLNHFPNHYELTRKDLMAKNIKKYRKEVEKDILVLANGRKMEINGDIIPPTYNLPQEHAMFLDDFIRGQSKSWIFKPAGKSQGSGISLITKISQARGLPSLISNLRAQTIYSNENFVISKYVDNPLLINGRKFDLRLYVLVTSYKPLKVWKYSQGFARVCFELYNSSPTTNQANGQTKQNEDPNKALFSHLTNVSFQKNSSSYNDQHGGKFPLASLLIYLEINYGREKTTKLMQDIEKIYLASLKAVQPVIYQDKHCFELYGYDILIDDTLRPWLIEVNACPSLVTTTVADKRMKKKLVNDLVNVVIPRNWFDSVEGGSNTCKEKQVGGFTLLYDEASDTLSGKAVRPKSSIKRPLQNSTAPQSRFTRLL